MNLASPVTAKLALIAGAACLLVGLAAGGASGTWLRGLRADAAEAQLRADHKAAENQWLADRNAITAKAQKDTEAALAGMKDAQARLAALDKTSQEKLDNALKQNAALRDAVATGDKRVRILTANLATAQRAASQHASGGNPGTGTVGDEEGAELSAEAGRTVLDLRAGIIEREAQIDYLQGYITDVVRQCRIRVE